MDAAGELECRANMDTMKQVCMDLGMPLENCPLCPMHQACEAAELYVERAGASCSGRN